jgi:WD40 repeat protein
VPRSPPVSKMWLPVVLAIAAVVATWFFVTSSAKKDKAPGTIETKKLPAGDENASDKKTKKKKGGNKSFPLHGGMHKKKDSKKSSAGLPSHPRFVKGVKGHTGNIDCVALSPNGMWLATSGSDQQLRITQVGHKAAKKGGEPVYFRIVIEKDTIASMSWASDSLTVVAAMEDSKDVCFYRMREKKDVPPTASGFKYELIELKKRRFPTAHVGKMHTCKIDTAHSAPVIITAGNCMADKTVSAYSFDGKKLSQFVNSYSSNGVVLSSDGKFVLPRSGAKEIKIHEVFRRKAKGQAEAVCEGVSQNSVMTLSGLHTGVVADIFVGGHDAPVAHGISDRVLTCGNDGILGLWAIDVHYKFNEDPKLLWSQKYSDTKFTGVTMSSDGTRFVVCDDAGVMRLFTIKTVSEAKCECREEVSIETGGIAGGVSYLALGPKSEFLYTCGFATKHAYVWDMKL